MPKRSLQDRSVIVTGGGTGIGAACALMLAAEGARVTICGRTLSRLEAVAEQSGGHPVQAVVADVTVEEDVVRLVERAVEFGDGLHGFVANAGGGGSLAPYHLQDAAAYEQVLRLNVLGTMLGVKHAVPQLAKSEGGSFVGMSSIAGHVTHPYFGAYGPSKAAVESIIRNAADEYGLYGIRFNAVQPGFIATEVMQGVPEGSPVWRSYIDQTPLGDVGQPDDVASVVRFLLSDESRWVTGQTLAVDGGHCLRRGPDFSSFVEQIHAPSDLVLESWECSR